MSNRPSTRERYLIATSSATLGLLGGWFARLLWTSRLQRIASVDQLVRLSTTPAARPVRLRGIVTRVGDADNFHLFHVPFWYRKALPVGGKAIRAAGTVHVRLAGVDAPEVSGEGKGEGRGGWGPSFVPLSLLGMWSRVREHDALVRDGG